MLVLWAVTPTKTFLALIMMRETWSRGLRLNLRYCSEEESCILPQTGLQSSKRLIGLFGEASLVEGSTEATKKGRLLFRR